jgi:hypothetical protein
VKPGPFAALHAAYIRRRHTSLLIVIVFALATRPLISDAGAGPIVFSLALLLVLVVSLSTIRVDEVVGEREVVPAQQRRRLMIVLGLACVAIAERLYMIVSPSPQVLLFGTIAWLLLLGFVAWSLLHYLLRQKEITGETITLSIAIYLLFGLTWGLLYAVILEIQPGALHFADPSLTIASEPGHVFPILIYFSLTTLTTVGFGDIVPASLSARYMAVAEGITGQFYLAILVARLVAMHMSYEQSKA